MRSEIRPIYHLVFKWIHGTVIEWRQVDFEETNKQKTKTRLPSIGGMSPVLPLSLTLWLTLTSKLYRKLIPYQVGWSSVEWYGHSRQERESNDTLAWVRAKWEKANKKKAIKKIKTGQPLNYAHSPTFPCQMNSQAAKGRATSRELSRQAKSIVLFKTLSQVHEIWW